MRYPTHSKRWSEWAHPGPASVDQPAGHAVLSMDVMSMTKLCLRSAALALPLLYLMFLIADRYGVWSRMRGLDKVEAVATRFEQSYSPDASRPVSVGDPEWKPLIHLIYQYSNVDFPKNKEPRTVARFSATLSGKQTGPEGQVFSEWTAPSTPFAVLYRRWPGQDVPKEDWRIAGTIGDLRMDTKEQR